MTHDDQIVRLATLLAEAVRRIGSGYGLIELQVHAGRVARMRVEVETGREVREQERATVTTIEATETRLQPATKN